MMCPPPTTTTMSSSSQKQDKGNMSLLSRCLQDQADDALVQTKRHKRVRFSTVEVREYALVIGDHPSCPDELALSLDWSYSPTTLVENVLAREKRNGRASTSPPRRLGFLDRRMRLQQASSEKDEIQRIIQSHQVKCAQWEEQSRTHKSVIDLDDSPNVTIVPLQ